MKDDYKYQPQPLPLKNEGLFGFGGKPSEGSRGFQGSITDVQGGGGGGGGIQGPPGPPGRPGNIDLPSGTGVLGIKDGVLFVYETIDCEDTGGTGP